MYSPGATVWKSREVKPFEMPFSTPLDLQLFMGLICALYVVLPWDCTKFGETFQIQDTNLEVPEERPNFNYWEQLDYDPELRMKLSPYIEEIR